MADEVVVDPDELLRLAAVADQAARNLEQDIAEVDRIVASVDRRGWNAGAMDGPWASAHTGTLSLASDLYAFGRDLKRQAADWQQFDARASTDATPPGDSAAGLIAGPLTDAAALLPVDRVGPALVNDVLAPGVVPVLPLDGAVVISLPSFGLGQPANAQSLLDVPMPSVAGPPSIGPSDRWYADQPVSSQTPNVDLPPLTGADVGLSDAGLMGVLGAATAPGATPDLTATETVSTPSLETPPWFSSTQRGHIGGQSARGLAVSSLSRRARHRRGSDAGCYRSRCCAGAVQRHGCG